MDKREKRSFEQMEDSSADVYEFSPSEHLLLEKWTGKRRTFMGVPHHCLDIDAKMAALKVSPSIVALVSFSGTGEHVLSQASGTIIETEQNYNIVMTSLHLIRRAESEFAENSLADNLKIVVRASDENSYVGKIHIYDFHYNLLIIKFKSKTPLPCAKLRMVDDDLDLGMSFQLCPHSLKFKPGNPVVVVGKYFHKDYDFMAASGFFRFDYFSFYFVTIVIE
ncbi:hypothetical protein RND81_09G150900 [Saponaria officinalis]|uniref:Uncharacterized protein n=1 Tax=Saponaria officinalis TaxID=3572 RepID=A0AAW1IL12_SAPOF